MTSRATASKTKTHYRSTVSTRQTLTANGPSYLRLSPNNLHTTGIGCRGAYETNDPRLKIHGLLRAQTQKWSTDLYPFLCPTAPHISIFVPGGFVSTYLSSYLDGYRKARTVSIVNLSTYFPDAFFREVHNGLTTGAKSISPYTRLLVLMCLYISIFAVNEW